MKKILSCCDEEHNKSKIDSFDLEGQICYCFNYSRKELRVAIQAGKEQVIVNDIKAKIKTPGCSCKTANPSGKCCIPDIYNFIKTHKNL